MAWKFDNVLSYNLPDQTTDMLFDGRDVWVLAGTSVYVFGYWDENSNYEGLYWGQYPDKQNPTPGELYLCATIDLSAYFTGVEVAYKLVKVYDKMYVVNGTPASAPYEGYMSTNMAIIDIPTKTFDSELAINQTAHCIPTSCNELIWFSNMAAEQDDPSDTQDLFYYDTYNAVWSANISIPFKKQFRPHEFIDGKDYVWCDLFNENGMARFNNATGAFSAQILVNRRPTGYFVTQQRDVIVASKNGMISSVEQFTPTTTNSWGTADDAVGVVDDGTYIWTILPELGRTLKSTTTDNFKFMDGGTTDYNLDDSLFSETEFNKIVLTPSFEYQFWNGAAFDTRIVKDYVFLLSDNYIQGFRNGALSRTNTIEVRGGAMVATGPEAYYGETT